MPGGPATGGTLPAQFGRRQSSCFIASETFLETEAHVRLVIR